jgi:3-hydroxy-9,10-secoandrosta-1,3,5(10)-triene-9,17-dione monooxygenase
MALSSPTTLVRRTNRGVSLAEMNTPVPDPPRRSTAELLAEARHIGAQLRQEQDESDARGSYSQAVHQRLLAGGFYRILQPRMFGGYGSDCDTYIRVIMELSRGHPSSGWCYTLASSHAMVAGAHFSEAVQRELFGSSGDFRSAYAVAPAGMPTLERSEAGYLISGVWPFASGIPVCTHFMGGALTFGADGSPCPIAFVVPREQIEILSDWGGDAAMGMQASGSNSVRLSRVFVPDAHIVRSPIMILSTDSLPEGTPGTRLHHDGLFLGIIFGWFSCEFGAILTGAARAALEEFERLLTSKPMMLDPTRKRMHDPHLQRILGEAMSRADAAEALTLQATRLYSEQCAAWMRERRPIRTADTLRVWGTAREGCRCACEAVEMLFQSAGASVARRGDRLQRYFRDVQMYRIHIQSQPMAPMLRAQIQLGVDVPPAFQA